MNRVDFTTSPTGMKLESDGTLGFLQSNLSDAILGLAKTLGVDNCILTGVVGNTTATDGWIVYLGELYYFQAGTVGATFVIEQVVVNTANENGTSVPRYYTRRAKWGSGGGAISFSVLKRLSDLKALLHAANVGLAAGGNGDVGDWVILAGCTPNGGNTTINEGLGMYEDRVINVPAYTPGGTISDGNPVYFNGLTGVWSSVDTPGAAIKFSPYAVETMGYFQRKSQYPIGGLVMFKTAGTGFLTTHFASGLGKYEWSGWAIADGGNGTLNLSAAIAGVSFIQRIS